MAHIQREREKERDRQTEGGKGEREKEEEREGVKTGRGLERGEGRKERLNNKSYQGCLAIIFFLFSKERHIYFIFIYRHPEPNKYSVLKSPHEPLMR